MLPYIVSFMITICAQASTWTGKVEEVYTIKALNAHIEGVVYHDGHLYGGSSSGVEMYKFDPDDFGVDQITEPVKTGTHTAGSQIILGACAFGDRVYGTLSTLFGLGGDAGTGIGYWDNDMEF